MYPSKRHRDRDEDGIVVRIIEYTFNDPGRSGSGKKHRLLTTLLDARRHPAERLIALYHERWEEELTIGELKTHQRERLVLRSQTPADVVQEIYGLLLGHFVNTLKNLRCRMPEAPRSEPHLSRWYNNLLLEVSQERLEPRRDRVNPRVIKRKMSNWPKKQEKHRNSPQPTKNFRKSIVMLD